MENRFLAMLNSSTSSQIPSTIEKQPVSSSLSVPTPKSPREPSPTPPPPSLQAVSLSDLFKSLGPPPLSTSTTSSTPPILPGPGMSTSTFQSAIGDESGGDDQNGTNSPISSQHHQAKLLGMLKNSGDSSGSSTGSLTPGIQVVSPPASGLGTPASSTGIGSGTHQQNLLNMFKNGPQIQAPVISHTSQPPIPQQPTPPLKSNPHSRNVSVDDSSNGNTHHYAVVTASTSTDTTSRYGTPPTQAPQKSMFDFVSPFDVFDKPKPTTTSGPVKPSAIPSNVENGQSSRNSSTDRKPRNQTGDVKPSPDELKASLNAASKAVNEASPQSAVSSDRNIASIPKTNAPQDNRTPERTRLLSGTGAATGNKKNDHGLIWHVGKVANLSEGKGPLNTTSDIVVDLSKPNHESLVGMPGVVQIIPTTIMKAENVAFTPGRTVGLTPGWVAYALARGRVRLIDSATGARLVLQLPHEATAGQILDLAVTPTSIAVVGANSSVTVFKVPSQWSVDDPPCQMILHVTPLTEGEVVDDGIGRARQIAWVKKDGNEADWLAIGGEDGVVLVKPNSFGDDVQVGMREIVTGAKILKTTGSVVSFCLNQSQQAIGLLSSTSQFTLYSVATLARVWNRQLPITSTLAPSSVMFCESNVLVGRANNTSFDLVQITLDVAILSTIKFIAPLPVQATQHFAQATYDASKGILWISPFVRGSLFGFRYALKGVQPIKAPKDVVGFDRLAEYPLDSVLSLVLGVKDGEAEGDADFFFATPNGFSQASISKEACEVLTRAYSGVPAPAPPQQTNTRERSNSTFKPSNTAVKSQVNPTTTVPEPAKKSGNIKQAVPTSTPPVKPSNKVESPILVKSELPGSDAGSDREGPIGKRGKGTRTPEISGDRSDVITSGLSMEDLAKALKKTEDTLSNKLKQSIQRELGNLASRLDNFGNSEDRQDLATDVAIQIERQIKTSLKEIISTEVKRTVLPALSGSLQSEIRNVIGSQLPGTVFDALQNVSKDLERGLAPHITRTVSTLTQPALERGIQDSLQHVLLPAITASSARIYEQLSNDLKSEMLQIRKEVISEQSEVMTSTKSLIQTMATSIQELQKQVATLSEQISKSSQGSSQVQPPVNTSVAPPPPPPALGIPPHGPISMPYLSSVSVPISQPPAPTAPVGPSLEDTFLTALAGQSTASTLHLVSEHYATSDICLPLTGSRSPLSQAVILTLLHRLALALNELNPSDPMYRMAVSWEHRAVVLLDRRDPGIASYLPRVVPVIQNLLANVLNTLNTRFANDPAARDHRMLLTQVLDILNQKSHI